MVTKDPPFNGANHIELLKKIENCKRLRFPPGLSDNCKDLIIRLLKRNPLQRITWDAFFNHPWLNMSNGNNNRNNKNNNNGNSPSYSNSQTPRTRFKNTTPTPFDPVDSDATPIPPHKSRPHHNKSKSAGSSKQSSTSPSKQLSAPKPGSHKIMPNMPRPNSGTPEFVLIDNGNGPSSNNSSIPLSFNNCFIFFLFLNLE